MQRTDGDAVERHLLALVAPGGRLLVVHHAPPRTDDPHAYHAGADFGSVIGPDSVRPLLTDGWTIEVDELRPRATHGGPGSHHVEDLVLRARRS